MCGIAGIARTDGRLVDPAVVKAMTDQLVHRGPDGEGSWLGGSIGLGHRRLSIIDPIGSPQPMKSADGRCHIVFNGEIFNYRALRDELASDGVELHTNGDTEVVLELFQRYGTAALHRLRGQFAFAIYDTITRQLWLVRDRMGILPLFWHISPDRLAFASEIKALLPALGRVPAVDEESIREYLAYRSVPAPNTLLQGVKKLPPGHFLRRAADGSIEVGQWWSLPDQPQIQSVSAEGAVEQVAVALQDAVRSALVADVPVGAFLSGGVDSSLIVALMASVDPQARIESFTAGFSDPLYDETPFARRVSALFNTQHHEVLVTAEDFSSLWEKLTWNRDAPLSEPADIALFRIAEIARTRVKVLLSGEGSDELFAGYPKYGAANLATIGDWTPRSVSVPVLGAVERALPARANRLRIAIRAAMAGGEAERARTWFAPFTEVERRELFPGRERDTHVSIWEAGRGDRVRRMLLADCRVWLPDNLLERGDRMSMAASVESRPPFMDHRLVELAFSLPSSVKVRRGVRKWVVKEVARRYLPQDLVDRKKVGFRVPLDRWFRGGLRDLARDRLLSGRSFVGGLMNRRMIDALLSSHESGRRQEPGANS